MAVGLPVGDQTALLKSYEFGQGEIESLIGCWDKIQPGFNIDPNVEDLGGTGPTKSYSRYLSKFEPKDIQDICQELLDD